MTNSIKRCRPLLGTFVELSFTSSMPEQKLIQWSNVAFDEIERIHNALSFHQQNSELSALNKALLENPQKPFKLSNDLNTILTFALLLFKKTAGHYDVSVASQLVESEHLPNHLALEKYKPLGNFSEITINNHHITSNKPVCLDLGGIAKGYAVDRAISLLPEDIKGNINAGGDMRFIDWKNQQIAVKYASRISALKKLPMLNSALATSASYYKKHGSQFFDPISNKYVRAKGSISVFAEQAMHADALTKVALIMNRKDAKSLLQDFNAKAISINSFGFSRQLA